MLKKKPRSIPPMVAEDPSGGKRVVTAKYSGHVWHVDLTTVPIFCFWCPWLLFALPQRWPFCWWLCVVVDISLEESWASPSSGKNQRW